MAHRRAEVVDKVVKFRECFIAIVSKVCVAKLRTLRKVVLVAAGHYIVVIVAIVTLRHDINCGDITIHRALNIEACINQHRRLGSNHLVAHLGGSGIAIAINLNAIAIDHILGIGIEINHFVAHLIALNQPLHTLEELTNGNTVVLGIAAQHIEVILNKLLTRVDIVSRKVLLLGKEHNILRRLILWHDVDLDG